VIVNQLLVIAGMAILSEVHNLIHAVHNEYCEQGKVEIHMFKDTDVVWAAIIAEHLGQL
jgi:hypothetical protein